MNSIVKTLDLHFQSIPGVIAAYLIPHSGGAILIECGPGSTVKNLTQQLAAHGYEPGDITDVLVTHIHLDHAGAAGWLSRQGATIHVHPVGAPHLIDPSRLIASAARIYGDQMERLWGEILPVPADKIKTLTDQEWIEINGARIFPIDTPGHASHHMVFFFEGICFSGDIGGVRMAGSNAIRAPMPPPEFHLEAWRESLSRIVSHPMSAIAPTHFGMFNDWQWHLERLRQRLDQAERWMTTFLPQQMAPDQLRLAFDAWIEQLSQEEQLPETVVRQLEMANPSSMSLDGMLRYWRKYRLEGNENRGT